MTRPTKGPRRRSPAARTARAAPAPRETPRSSSLGPIAAWIVFGVALALRVAHVLAIRGNPWFDHPIIDAETYDAAARAIAAGHGHPDRVFWQPPGYAYFLAGVYALTGGAPLFTRLLQAVLGAVTAVLTARLGSLAFGRGVGFAAGLIVAVCGSLIHLDSELLPTVLGIPLQVGTLLAVEHARRRPGWKPWAASGLLAGAAAIVIANALLYVLMAAVVAKRHAAVVVAAAALFVLPVAYRNLALGGEPVLVSYNAGINFYIGNNPNPDSTLSIRPDLGWKRLSLEPASQGVHGLAASSNYFVGKSLRWMAQDPVAALALQARKGARFHGGHEIYRNQAIYPFREWSPVLAATLWQTPWLAFPWGILAPLAVVGLAATWRRAPFLAAATVVYAASVIAFFVTERYRLPVVPLAAIFAMAGVAWFAHAPTRARLASAAAFLVLAFLSNTGQPPPEQAMNVDAEYSLGAALMSEGNSGDARTWFDRVVRRDPRYTEAWTNLGILAATEGRPAEAEQAFTRAVELAPGENVVLVNLARWRENHGRLAEALTLYDRAVAADPTDRETATRADAIRAFLAASAEAPH